MVTCALVTCVLAVPSLAGMDGPRSLVMSVDVIFIGPGLCIEPGDEFLKSEFFSRLSISLMMIKVKEKDHSIT